jgi:hypothetical protein
MKIITDYSVSHTRRLYSYIITALRTSNLTYFLIFSYRVSFRKQSAVNREVQYFAFLLLSRQYVTVQQFLFIQCPQETICVAYLLRFMHSLHDEGLKHGLSKLQNGF